jgi:D-3-phosphoglycerate dehydrogenase / 2-oxoglutarate reductase
MLRRLEEFIPIFNEKDIEIIAPKVVQTLTEEELFPLVSSVDGWIIGDDPATERVVQAAKAGRLKAAVKWGVGVDNINFEAFKKYGIPIRNTPGMFGKEVATVALGYVLGLARQLFYIDRGVRNGQWLKPSGMSLQDKVAYVVGFGDIGKETCSMLKAFGMKVIVSDPFAKLSNEDISNFEFHNFPNDIEKADYIILTAALTASSKHMLNSDVLSKTKKGVMVVNVSRGPLIEEKSLIKFLESGHIGGAGLDVFEVEPLPTDSPFLKMDNVILGTHNGSNTIEGVRRASHQAIEYLFDFLNIKS